jgi:hypothetical protein
MNTGRLVRVERVPPSSRWVRLPIAILLIVAGVFSFLPVLGLWMLPLGLMLLAADVPFLKRPMGLALVWLERQLKRLSGWYRGRNKQIDAQWATEQWITY